MHLVSIFQKNFLYSKARINQKKNKFNKGIKTSLIGINSVDLLIAIFLFILMFSEKVKNKPVPILSDPTIQSGINLINGQLEFGYYLSFSITNISEPGIITVMPSLISKEGIFKRITTCRFEKIEKKKFIYFFQEPNLTTADITFEILTLPKLRSKVN